jgi:uncharacterized membrane protein YbhN (UPF0104 family)
MDKAKQKNIIKCCLKLAFTAVALWLVFRKVDFGALGRIWNRANPWWFIPAVLSFAFSQFISSFRLLNFFRNIRLPVAISFNLRLYLQGMFYNIFLPGGIGGDGYKIVVLSRKFNEKAKVIFTAIFLDRLSGLWALCLLIIIMGVMTGIAPSYGSIAIMAFVAGTAVYYFVISRYFNRHIKRFPASHGLALVVQGLQALCAFCILMSLGHEGSKLTYLFIFLLSSFATLFPFSIGGLGAREIAIVWGASALLLNKDLSVSVSLCFYIISALVSLLGAITIFSKSSRREVLYAAAAKK